MQPATVFCKNVLRKETGQRVAATCSVGPVVLFIDMSDVLYDFSVKDCPYKVTPSYRPPDIMLCNVSISHWTQQVWILLEQFISVWNTPGLNASRQQVSVSRFT
jgi:hypothetical protein